MYSIVFAFIYLLWLPIKIVIFFKKSFLVIFILPLLRVDTVQVHRLKLRMIVRFLVQRCSHLNADPLKARAVRSKKKVN